MAEAGYLEKNTPHPGDRRGYSRLGRGLLICGLMAAGTAGCFLRDEVRSGIPIRASGKEDSYLAGMRLIEKSNSTFRGSISHEERTYSLSVIPYSETEVIELRIGTSRKLLSVKADEIGKTTSDKSLFQDLFLCLIRSVFQTSLL